MSWTAQAFDRWYLVVYPHRDDGEARRAVGLVGRMGSLGARRVLDLGCGPGRHLEAFLDEGARPVGLDQSATLLAEAKRRPRVAEGAPLVRGDMRTLPFGAESFDGAASLFTTFGYDTEEDDRRILAEVARVLSPRAFFFLDFLNRETVLAAGDSASVVARDDVRIRTRRTIEEGGRRVAKQVRIEPIDEAGALAEYEERVTLYGAAELRALVASAGLDVLHVWGDYDGGRFEPASSARCILYAERGGA